MVEVKLIGFPTQTGEFDDAFGAAGIGFTTTLYTDAAEVHPPAMKYPEYAPELLAVAGLMVGFCVVDVNEFGPVQ